ncbi:PREDICTED: tyrosine-protein phosphatase non-receptor type substrate 1-like [Nestor notabilis]|uniref:tyrosine-protein phosphatase non-receptor type substrate 1-like n=1 Tax=Nestor notabilis TaxID=176057 RepID=UPI00052333EB|nr:PREDICTED: tyrosine-protein phosphatase non-receptor type substrate 1-like [Nestor notabilis]
MELLPRGPWPLTCLVLLSLPGAGAQADQDFKLHQPQDQVWVTAGETLTLTCTTSGDGPVGPVKWLKGWGSENETIYEQTGTFPRVTRAVTGSNTDFTIHIRDVRPEDAGTYYCVKFQRFLQGTEVFQHGKGTEVSIQALDPETSHLPSQQSTKEDNNIHYADLQPLPAAPQLGRSPHTARSEYASIRVAAK